MAAGHCSLGLCLLLLGGTLELCAGARILCVSHQFGSHLLMVHTVGDGLIEQGHEVYTVLSDKMKEPAGLREKGFNVLKFHTPDDHLILSSPEVTEMLVNFESSGGMGDQVAQTGEITANECKDMDQDAAFQQKLESLKFDLLIINIFPVSTCMMFLSLKLNVPFVIMQADIDMDLMRTPILPSFAPHSLMVFSDNMSFFQRLVNTLVVTVASLEAVSPMKSIRDVSLIDKYSKDPEVRAWKDLARKAELFFIARGPMLEYALPLTPNVINIECLTCKPANPLPEDVVNMIDKYETVIVVSFGSQVDKLPIAIAEKFLAAFGEIKDALFFWRFKLKLAPDTIPANVKIMKWLPQNDLLAHPKTKLFITHSGNNGQHESVYHGVPMLAFPLSADQPHNAVRIVTHGYGLSANIHDFTTEELINKMKEILGNPTYREKTQKAGRILKSAPMDAIETAAFWIEHVIEFGGDHLRSHGLKMSWCSYYMFDILFLVEVTLVAFLCMSIFLCKCLVRSVRAPKPKEKKH